MRILDRKTSKKDLEIEESYFSDIFMTKAVADPEVRERIEEVVGKWIEL